MTSTNSVGAKSNVLVDDVNEIGAVCIDNEGERMYSFLCNIVWPTATIRLPCSLNALVSTIKMDTKSLVADRAQWLTETMFNDGYIDNYEACASIQ